MIGVGIWLWVAIKGDNSDVARPLPAEINEEEGLGDSSDLVDPGDVPVSSDYEKAFSRRYNEEKDPFKSHEAKISYYNWRAEITKERFGRRFISDILRGLQSENRTEIQSALNLVRRYEVHDAVPYLLDLLDSGDPMFHRAIVTILLGFDEDEGYEFLLDSWRALDTSRWAMEEVFYENERLDFIPELYAIMEDWKNGWASGGIRAARALAHLGEPIPYSALLSEESYENLAYPIIQAIVRAGDASAMPLLREQFLNSDQVSTKLHAAYALARFGTEEFTGYIWEIAEMAREYTVDYSRRGPGIMDLSHAFRMLLELEVPDAMDLLQSTISETASADDPSLRGISMRLIRDVLAREESEAALEVMLELYQTGEANRNTIARSLFLFDEPRANELTATHFRSPPHDPRAVEEFRRVAEAFGWRGIFEQLFRY